MHGMIDGYMCLKKDIIIDTNDLAEEEGWLSECESLEEAALKFPKLLKAACGACSDFAIEKWPPTWKHDDELELEILCHQLGDVKSESMVAWINEENIYIPPEQRKYYNF